jgi:drug/metabolite transporter (DMT)-like permease
MPSRQETQSPLRGIVLLILAVSLFGAVDGLSKILVDTQSFGQIVFARYALALPFLMAAVGPSAWSGLFRTARPGLQLLRGLAPLIIGGTMVIGVNYLPLAEATVILFAGPFMVVALSGRFLGEKVGLSSWIGVAVGFLAVLVVARPGLGAVSGYAIFPFVGAVFYALFQLLTRRLAAAGEDANVTLAWTLAVGLIISAPLAYVQWVPVSGTMWLIALALGAVFGLGQLLMVRAFSYAPANVLTPFSYTQIIAATVFGIIAFGDFPDFWTIVGMAMIVAAGAYVMRSTSA